MHKIIIQRIEEKAYSPNNNDLKKWVKNALDKRSDDVELTIRIVDVDEMTSLNETYRRKKGHTNVLSFPFSTQPGVEMDPPILGDIVICAEVVNQEADEQHKEKDAHWAHMITHGVLHLLGYDHETDNEALEMETLETELLATLGLPDPYHHGEK